MFQIRTAKDFILVVAVSLLVAVLQALILKQLLK